jgi:hypothetical protein
MSDGLRLDYQLTTDCLRTLTGVRFKLLALVPKLSGAAIALLGTPAQQSSCSHSAWRRRPRFT